jgi:hypothetical protein
MKDSSTLDPLVDEFGALLEAAAEDPSRVVSLKAQMRARLAGRAAGAAAEQAPEDAGDEEDLWNNLPV